MDLEAFASPAASLTALVEPPVRPHVEVSSVVQVDGIGRREMDRVTTLVLASANVPSAGEGPLRVQSVYDEERCSLRLVIFGSVGATAELLRLVDALTGPGAA